jgi:hypothetical protein
MRDDAPITREDIREALGHLSLEWGVEEDADVLIDLLLEAYTLEGAWTWLSFHNRHLGGTPLVLLEQGSARAVFREARRLVSQVAS